MPDLLREQFPHLRPIVEAFGYRNLEFEGWEADDVIATLATRADGEGIRTCVVSTDRDAFQLCSENVCLMMTPRGVADVNVYTPDRVFARYGVTPEQVPDFIGLKGDTSDNIPGVPGIGDKTAGQLIAQYGSLEAVIDHASDLSPARSRNIAENADLARASKELATMRRDLDIDCDPAQLVLEPPDRAQLKEIFRRFEFRALLGRVDELDAAVPSAPLKVTGIEVPWREGELDFRGVVGYASDRRPRRRRRRRLRHRRPRTRERRRRARRARREAAARQRARRHAARRIPDRSGPGVIRPRRPGRGVRRRAAPDAGGRRGDDSARPPRRNTEPADRAAPRTPRRTGRHRPLSDRRAAAHRRARGDGRSGREDRHLPHGRDHGPARRSRRGARVARAGARRRGVRARLAAAARPDPVREARAHRRPQGQDRLLDRREGAALHPRRPRDRAGDRGVARAVEAPQHLSGAAALAHLRARRPAPHDVQPDRRGDRAPLDVGPEPAVDPRPDRPRPRDPLGVHRRGGPPAPVGRLLADRAADPRACLGGAEAPRGVRARRGHPHRHRRRGARGRAGAAHVRRSVRSRR